MSISVVVPTYNRADLLGATLDAILAQAPDEVIVVDDGSTDATPALLDSYGDRIRAIRIANGGDMVARNVGTRAARGARVAFCDSDDVWQPGFLAGMAALWQAEPMLAAGYADFRILRDGALCERTKFADAPADFWHGLRPLGADGGVFDAPIVERLLRFQPFFPSAMMVARRAFLDLGGWDEAVSRMLGCDFATVLRLAARPGLGVLRRPLVAIRKHAGNISGDNERMELGDALVLEHVLRTRPELGPVAPAIRRSIAVRRGKALDSAFARRDFAAVRAVPATELTAKQRIKRSIGQGLCPWTPPEAKPLDSINGSRAIGPGGVQGQRPWPSLLFITPMLPPLSASEAGGKHRRARVFLHALAGACERLEILYLVPERMQGLPDLDRTQSDFWGVELKVSLLARSTRRETAWNHYGRGIFDAAGQPRLFPYAGAALRQAVAQRVAGERVFVDRLDAAMAVLGGRPRALLFDMDDVYHKVLLRDLRHGPMRPGKLGLALHLPALIQAERRAVAAAALTFVCSETDAVELRRLRCGGDVRVVPNAIVPPPDPPGLVAARTVLFLGAYHYPPNRLAAERLATRIWPLVRTEIADATLVIAGAGGDAMGLAGPGVSCRGFVDDLDALYGEVRAVCSPLEQGGGTRLKLIEAAAYARPMVSTRMGAEGLALRDDVEILLRDSDAEIARACVTLLRDDALCLRLGAAARAAMLARYDARAVERQVAEMLGV